MYAIINIAGQQFKVEKDQQIFVHRLPQKEGDKITLDEVLFVENGDKIEVGAPAVSGASVTAKVIEHVKGDKVIVFKKKRRKGYQTRNGHRQQFTKLAIDGISLGGTKKAEKAEAKPAPKAETKKAAPAKTAEPKAAAPKAAAPKVETPKAAVSKTEKKAAPKTKKTDDFKVIEGVGPKIAELIQKAGIASFKDLAKTSVEKLNEILTEAGGSYASHNPETWPEQAKLAADGKFDELKEWQDKLDGGIKK